MWMLSLALFFAAKWVTLSPLLFPKRTASEKRLFAYAFLWPGLNARRFCAQNIVPGPPTREWLVAGAKAMFGATLIWAAAYLLPTVHPMARGWLAMIGIVFLLHFGLFHLLSLFWRKFGIDAEPIMRSSGMVTSLSQFWGGSWNTAFTDFMHAHVFRPLARSVRANAARFAVFAISGLLHELVISLPARGGYGLPTAYFMIQVLALTFESSKTGRKLGLGSGWKGRCFVALITVGPVYVLFHPIFVRNVILPMLNVIRAT
jgi:hypothetical protein